MKRNLTLVLLLSLLSLVSAQATEKQTITCKHFAATEILESISLEFTVVDGKWSRDVKITVQSDEFVMPNGTREGHMRKNPYDHYTPEYSNVYFEGCVDCDFDGADITFSYDDDLGLLGTLSYVSDGPVFTQFLKCTSSEE